MSSASSPLFAFRLAKPLSPSGTFVGTYDPKSQLWVKKDQDPHASWNYYWTLGEVPGSTPNYFNTVTDYDTDDGVNPVHTDSYTALDSDPDSDLDVMLDQFYC